MSRDEDSFISRWSRRKRGADTNEPGPVDPPVPEGAGPVEQPPTEAPRTDEEILEELGLPDPDSLGPGDDFAAFLREAVPRHLKQRALRRLWRSNPVLANLDGLNDYDTDFTGDTVAPGMLKTAYKVGRGFLPDPASALLPGRGAETPAPTEPGDAVPATDDGDGTAVAESDSQTTEQEAESPEGKECAEMQEIDTPPSRRRMQFHFPGDE